MNHNEYSKKMFEITFSICLREIRNNFMIIVQFLRIQDLLYGFSKKSIRASIVCPISRLVDKLYLFMRSVHFGTSFEWSIFVFFLASCSGFDIVCCFLAGA